MKSITGMSSWEEGIVPYAKSIRLTEDCVCVLMHQHMMCNNYGTYEIHLLIMKSGQTSSPGALMGHAAATLTLGQ